MKFTSVFTLAVTALIAAGSALPAVAQPALHQPMMTNGSAPKAPKVVKVARCDPESAYQANAPIYPGFVPGFYPGGGYYFNDVYGYRYNQAALSAGQSGTLYVDYTNVTPKVMKSIEFGLVANGRLVAEVRDVGTFSPQVSIKHQFGLNPNVFPLQTGLAKCVALRVTYADGTKWTSPRLPALQRRIYGSAGGGQ